MEAETSNTTRISPLSTVRVRLNSALECCGAIPRFYSRPPCSDGLAEENIAHFVMHWMFIALEEVVNGCCVNKRRLQTSPYRPPRYKVYFLQRPSNEHNICRPRALIIDSQSNQGDYQAILLTQTSPPEYWINNVQNSQCDVIQTNTLKAAHQNEPTMAIPGSSRLLAPTPTTCGPRRRLRSGQWPLSIFTWVGTHVPAPSELIMRISAESINLSCAYQFSCANQP